MKDKKINSVVFLLGFPKCKTSSITKYLATTHNLVLLDGHIESHIFSDNKRISMLVKSMNDERQFIDGSLSYLFDENALSNIVKFVSQPIFIFTLRNYSARFLSHWNYNFKRSESFITELNEVGARMSDNGVLGTIFEEEKVLVEKYIQSNNLDFKRCSRLFLQHIVFENGKIDYNFFSQIESELKKGPTSFFRFELKRFLETGSFLPYASILSFNYYWHNIRDFITRIKALGISKPLIYVVEDASDGIYIPGFEKNISISLPELNRSNYTSHKNLQIDSFFKHDEMLKHDLLKSGVVTLL